MVRIPIDNGPVDKILKDCDDYTDSVTFFSVFKDEMDKAKLSCEVEHDFKISGSKRENRNPDFAIMKGNDIIDVIEHKASISSPQNALEEFTDAEKQYRILDYNGVVSKPSITVLYPEWSRIHVDKVRDKVPSDVSLCAFDQTSADDVITFKLEGDGCCDDVKEILDGNSIRFKATAYSKYKFIRRDPPIPYTAFQIWGLLYGFLDSKSSDKVEIPVSYKELCRRAEYFFPPWIRNNHQVKSNRMMSALKFLQTTKFVKIAGDDTIVRYSNRGTKSGDLQAYFAKKYAEKIMKIKDADKAKKRKSIARTNVASLDNFL